MFSWILRHPHELVKRDVQCKDFLKLDFSPPHRCNGQRVAAVPQSRCNLECICAVDLRNVSARANSSLHIIVATSLPLLSCASGPGREGPYFQEQQRSAGTESASLADGSLAVTVLPPQPHG
jgi:hypothetical protein